jgi:chemotaxis protein methyltransferase CheR
MAWTLSTYEGTALRAAVKALCGITVPPDKDYLLVGRLEPVALAAGIRSAAELARALGDVAQRDLRREAVAAITTHETSFFRDGHPWEALRKVLPDLCTAARTAGRRPRIWSAACSTGQEPYTLAMVLAEVGRSPSAAGEPPEMVATDVCERTVAAASEGSFTELEINRGLPPTLRDRWFARRTDGRWQAKETLRSGIIFKRHNLLDSPALLGRFDLIVLRNVLIYFDRTARTRILTGIRNALQPGGVLLIGSSESLSGDTTDLQTRMVGPTMLYVAPAKT